MKQLNDNFKVSAGKPLDYKYLFTDNTPYTGTTQVCESILLTERYKGLTVLINDSEYWFKDGVEDSDLILKQETITANNAITISNGNAVFGGSLTGATTVDFNNHYLTLGTTTNTSGGLIIKNGNTEFVVGSNELLNSIYFRTGSGNLFDLDNTNTPRLARYDSSANSIKGILSLERSFNSATASVGAGVAIYFYPNMKTGIGYGAGIGQLTYELTATGTTAQGKFKLKTRDGVGSYFSPFESSKQETIITTDVLKISGISGATASRILYYNPTTKVVSYGSYTASTGTTGDYVETDTYTAYTGATNTLINNKLNTSVFNSYTGGTVTLSTAQTITGKKIFSGNTTNAGINIANINTDPSSLNEGDIWLNSNALKRRYGSNTAFIPFATSVSSSRIPFYSGGEALLTNNANFRFVSSETKLYTPNINLTSTPPLATGGTQILVRDNSTGDIHYKPLSGFTSSGGSSYTFGNGIGESGGSIKLGGNPLTENTTLSGEYELSIPQLTSLYLGGAGGATLQFSGLTINSTTQFNDNVEVNGVSTFNGNIICNNLQSGTTDNILYIDDSGNIKIGAVPSTDGDYVETSLFNNYTGTTLTSINNKLSTSSFNTYSASTLSSINNIIAATSAYTVTNGTTDRTFNADSFTMDELADVVATLISDLKAKNIIS